MGVHHLSLAVYGDALAEVEDRAGRARGRLADSGAVVVEERLGLEAAFWSQLPGNAEWRTRPGAINSRNFAGLSSFDNFPAGASQRPLGRAIARFRTDGGHGLRLRATCRRRGDDDHFRTDRLRQDRFADVSARDVRAVHGRAEHGLRARAAPSCSSIRTVVANCWSAPVAGPILNCAAVRRPAWRRCADSRTPRRIGISCAAGSSRSSKATGRARLSPEEEKRLERAIARQLSMPVELRSLAGLREYLGHSDPMGLGPRLEKWCRGNALGWAFDGDVDEVRIDEAITGFDMTQLLEHDEVCAPAGAYLLYRVTQILDGRRVVLSIDEFRFYLKNPQFAAVVDNLLLTVRKSNGAVFLALQMPEHILESPLGPSIVAQCQTKIMFASPTADHDVYIDGLKCTEGEYRAVREDLVIGRRRFLLKREQGSVICEFDLGDMREYIAVLSGRANTVRLAEKLRRQLGEEPDRWLPEFLQRYHEATD